MNEEVRSESTEGVQSSHDSDDATDESTREQSSGSDHGGRLHPELGAGAEAGAHPQFSGVDDDPREPGAFAAVGDGDREGSAGGTTEVLKEILEDLPSSKRSQLSTILLALTRTSSSDWSGMLPPPDEFYKFAPEDRERMMRWNDSGTVDESVRQDRLVDVEIEQARKGPVRAVVIVSASLAAAAVSGWVFENTALAALFLGSPLLMFAQSLISTIRSQASATNGSRGEDD